MGKSKSIDLLSIPDSEKIKLMQEIGRRIKQRVLEEKLARSLLGANGRVNYPKGIGITVEDSMRKAVEEPKTKRSYS